jgi:hypothetical protein
LLALLVLGIGMLLGDLFLARLHGYAALSWVTPFIYAGFFVQALLGRLLRASRGGALLAAIGGSLGFFALSNLGVWVASGMYAHTGSGLAACYVAALPFLGRTLFGDVIWTLLLTVAYQQMAPRMGQGRAVPLRQSAEHAFAATDT